MKKLLAAGLSVLAMCALPAMADITVKMPANSGLDSLDYNYTTILNLANAKSRAERGTVSTKVPVKDNAAVLPIGTDNGGYSFQIVTGERSYIPVYALPGDDVVVEIASLEPLDYNMSGSALVDDMNKIDEIEAPFVKQINEIASSENPDRQKMQEIYGNFLDAIKDFIEENPTSTASCIAIMNLQGEDFDNAYKHLGERAKTSAVYPLVQRQNEMVQQSLAKERKLKELSSGNVVAPNFTLEDLNGKMVSLSDFKGKWVILDFWGSWCPWCIKGFPELKEAYEKYKGELEIIGVDCREDQEAWKKGVEKYELPWVNVYNPETSSVLNDYAVSGFPTKAIINPEGKIANITVGHDPAFFDKLKELMGK